MRILEVRRHTMRVKPGQHLSQAGVRLARKIGEKLPPFDLVITSPIARAYETAIAMGFAVDEELDALAMMPDGLENEVAWDAGFGAYGQALKRGGITGRYAREMAALWCTFMERLPEHGRALVITHGGIVEAGSVACLPQANHAQWGGFCHCCEGVRLSYDQGQFIAAEILRVEAQDAVR